MNVTPIIPVRPGTYDVHVVPFSGSWAVKCEGASTYCFASQTQTEAIGYGMRLARQSAAMLVIHGRDGQFREVRNYN